MAEPAPASQLPLQDSGLNLSLSGRKPSLEAAGMAGPGAGEPRGGSVRTGVQGWWERKGFCALMPREVSRTPSCCKPPRPALAPSVPWGGDAGQGQPYASGGLGAARSVQQLISLLI